MSNSNMPASKINCEWIIQNVHFQGPYRLQNWPFRDSTINYITKNPPSAKVWQKLVKTCKYFYSKNPIVVVERLKYCKKNGEIFGGMDGDNKRIPAESLSRTWWICDRLDMTSDESQDFFSSVIMQLYRIDVKVFDLFKYTITLNEFLFLSPSIEEIYLLAYAVRNDEDGSIVSFQKLVEALPNVKKICLYDGNHSLSISEDTVKTLLEIPHFQNITHFFLNDVPESFNIGTFFKYIKESKHVECGLSYSDTISDAYKNRLEAIVDKIISSETHAYKPPLIKYGGLSEEKYTKLKFLGGRFKRIYIRDCLMFT